MRRPPERTSPEAAGATAAEVGVDVHGTIVGWNDGAAELLGYPASEALGRPLAEFLVATDLPQGHGSTGDAAAFSAWTTLRRRDGGRQGCSVRVWDVPGTGPLAWTARLTSGRPGDEEFGIAVLETFFDESPVGLYVYGTDLRLLRCNPAAETMEGSFSAQPLGLRPGELWPNSNADVFERELARVLETGAPLTAFDKHGVSPVEPDRDYVFAVSACRLHERGGTRVIGVAVTASDVTERRMAERRVALLADASARIGTELDVVRTGQQLAEVAVPGLADAVAVEVLHQVLGGEEPQSRPSGSDLRRIGLHRAWGSASARSAEMSDAQRFPFPPLAEGGLSEPEPKVFPVALPVEPRDSPGEGAGAGTAATALVVPLRARGAVLGLATFYRPGGAGTFGDADVVAARDLVSRAAVCIDNARRYVRERNAARALQREMLPGRFPRQSAVETAHHFVATGTGADWYDVIPLSGARVALVVGSLMGSGLSAAAAMGRLRAGVHTLAETDPSPDELIARLDVLAARISAERREIPAGATGRPRGDVADATVLYAVYDPTSGHLSLATAGHPVPVLSHPDGTAQPTDAPAGPPLGSGEGVFETTELDVPTGSTLAFYTPGLLVQGGADAADAADARDSLAAMLSGAGSATLEETAREVTARLLPENPEQEAALLLARTHRLGEDRVAVWDLPDDPAVVATVRVLVERQLEAWNLQEQAFATELIASELVTNAIRYAAPPIRLRLLRDQRLICEVSDTSTTAPHLRYARAGDEGGRGLFLVSQLTKRWGTRYTESGKTIWTEQ